MKTFAFFEDDLPEDQNRESGHAHDDRAEGDVVEHRGEARQGRLAAFGRGLIEAEVTLGVGVVTDRVRNLLEDDEQPDAREHPLDHGRREEVPDDATAREAEQHLHGARDHDRGEEEVEPLLDAAEVLDGGVDDDREARRRARDAEG